MFKRFTNACVRVVNRWLPDAFLFAVILTFVGTLFADQRLVFEHFCYLSFAIKNGFALQLRLALVCDRAVYAIRPCLISPGKAPVNLARVHTRREGATE